MKLILCMMTMNVMNMMTEDRQMIMIAVLEGKLPPEAVTMEELQEVEDTLFELIAAKKTPFDTWETLQ